MSDINDGHEKDLQQRKVLIFYGYSFYTGSLLAGNCLRYTLAHSKQSQVRHMADQDAWVQTMPHHTTILPFNVPRIVLGTDSHALVLLNGGNRCVSRSKALHRMGEGETLHVNLAFVSVSAAASIVHQRELRER